MYTEKYKEHAGWPAPTDLCHHTGIGNSHPPRVHGGSRSGDIATTPTSGDIAATSTSGDIAASPASDMQHPRPPPLCTGAPTPLGAGLPSTRAVVAASAVIGVHGANVGVRGLSSHPVCGAQHRVAHQARVLLVVHVACKGGGGATSRHRYISPQIVFAKQPPSSCSGLCLKSPRCRDTWVTTTQNLGTRNVFGARVF
ncbi:hypothetical protein T484DRAFT_3519663 [Baffinella frigidus]|nr:hypothetical protein T484DRAFT_3519663 [Cryptophyta sp. CCMP2293]